MNTMIKDGSPMGWGRFRSVDSVIPITTASEHDLALSVIDRLFDQGAMNHAHPQNALFTHLFDAIHTYEHATDPA